jgi:hypothetical protein
MIILPIIYHHPMTISYRITKYVFIFLAITVSCGGLPVFAQFSDGFVRISFPTTATITRFVAHSNTFFAITSDGVFQTNSSGQNWQKVSINGQYIQTINSFNNRLYTRIDSNYLVSNDNAVSWLPSAVKMADYYIVSSSAIFKIVDSQLHRSMDGGITWSLTFSERPVINLIVFRSKVYISTESTPVDRADNIRGCFVSTNNGDTWQRSIIKSSNSIFGPVSFSSFTLLPDSTLIAITLPSRFVVGTYCTTPRSQGLYRLNDTLWEPITPLLQANIVQTFGKNILAVGIAGCNDMQWTNGGLFISRDAQNWNPVPLGWGAFNMYCNDCIAPSVVGVANDGIVYIVASRILAGGPPTFRVERQAVLLRSLSSITTSVQQNEVQSVENLTISPNPTATNVVIQGQAQKAGVAVVTLLNSVGGIVLQERITVSEGAPYYRDVDVRHLAPGMYIVQVEENGQKATRKLIKQ